MRADLTDLTILLDRSSSMHGVEAQTIEGFNSLIVKQKLAPGECRVTLIQFADGYDALFVAKPLAEVPLLTAQTYQATGHSTAYLDALAGAIRSTGARLAALPEADRPATVMIVSITDGQENSSREFSRHAEGHARVKSLREHQESKYSWNFVIMGQDYDPTKDAQAMGYNPSNVIQTAKAATADAYEQLSKGLLNVRSGQAGAMGANGVRASSGAHVTDFKTAMTDHRTSEQIAADQQAAVQAQGKTAV